jgi:hypothetical protein
MGWTQGHEAFRQLTAEQQVPYVEKFFVPKISKALHSAGRLHWAAFLPATMTPSDDPDQVIAGKDGPHADAYAANSMLDVDGDGTITGLGNLDAWTWKQCKGSRWEEISARVG